jgi:hypothetical protein
MGQAMNECRVSGRYNAGSSVLSKLAGVSPGQRYAWSYWYGKSFGTLVTENGTQYYSVNYTGSNSADLGRSLYLYGAGNLFGSGTGSFGQTGGDHTAPVGNWPGVPGRPVQGFFRAGTNITMIVVNGSLDGVTFQSSIGDNVTFTNDISYSLQIGSNLWTFYGAPGAINQGAPRTYTVNFIGGPNRGQPPNGYVNGQPPATGTGSGGASISHHCFVAGALVLMADGSWKPVETLQAGDMVRGPDEIARVERLHVATVGRERQLLTFREDPHHIWTSDHPHWVRQANREWWWSGQSEYLRRAAEIGLITGLHDPASVLTGPAEFAHLTGFQPRTPVPLEASPDTQVYVPVVQGMPIIVNGYLTSGFMNEQAYDYQQLDWSRLLQVPA